VIPICTTIIQDLSAAHEEDQGVKTLKKSLLASMTRRCNFEGQEMYAVATLLHPR
jgi:hypothetical protein